MMQCIRHLTQLVLGRCYERVRGAAAAAAVSCPLKRRAIAQLRIRAALQPWAAVFLGYARGLCGRKPHHICQRRRQICLVRIGRTVASDDRSGGLHTTPDATM
jgi:hypothetical protein